MTDRLSHTDMADEQDKTDEDAWISLGEAVETVIARMVEEYEARQS